jgi:hypothetical protein
MIAHHFSPSSWSQYLSRLRHADYPRSNNMAHLPKASSTRLSDRSSFVIVRNTTPPRDPDTEEEDENEDEEQENDEPPAVREPDED